METTQLVAEETFWFSGSCVSMAILLNVCTWWLAGKTCCLPPDYLLAFGLHFRQTNKLHERAFGRADKSAAATLKTVEHPELGGICRPVGLNINADFFWLKPHGAGVETPATADALRMRCGIDFRFGQ